VIVLRALEHFELGQKLTAEAVLGNHALDGVFDQKFRVLGADLFDGLVFFAALPAGIAHVFLGGFLLAGDLDLFGIDDDDEVTGVEVRGIDGFVFAAQNVGNLHSQSSEHGAIGVNHVPLALVQIYFRQMRFHLKIPIKGRENYQMCARSQ
jgi:hypothetical protein